MTDTTDAAATPTSPTTAPTTSPTSPSETPSSFDVVARAVLRSGPRVLLARFADRDFWFLPGGTVRPGEAARTALARELRDELSLEVRLGDLLAVAENQYTLDATTHHEVNLVFEAAVEGHFDHTQRTDLELRWFETDITSTLDIRPRSLANVVRYGPGRARLPLLSDGLGD